MTNKFSAPFIPYLPIVSFVSELISSLTLKASGLFNIKFPSWLFPSPVAPNIKKEIFVVKLIGLTLSLYFLFGSKISFGFEIFGNIFGNIKLLLLSFIFCSIFFFHCFLLVILVMLKFFSFLLLLN